MRTTKKPVTKTDVTRAMATIEANIKELVRLLGDPDDDVSEEASRMLLQIGEPAVEPLAGDPEALFASSSNQSNFRYQIYSSKEFTGCSVGAARGREERKGRTDPEFGERGASRADAGRGGKQGHRKPPA